jgi:hypothetical protein
MEERVGRSVEAAIELIDREPLVDDSARLQVADRSMQVTATQKFVKTRKLDTGGGKSEPEMEGKDVVSAFLEALLLQAVVRESLVQVPRSQSASFDTKTKILRSKLSTPDPVSLRLLGCGRGESKRCRRRR